MRIITISREFGSGGRELGKRLADELGTAYYDKEILAKIAERVRMDEHYIDQVLERSYTVQYPYTFQRSFTMFPPILNQRPNLLAEQAKVIRDLANKEDCVIVGRGANALLREQKPFNIFVYADMEAKRTRCRERAAEDEQFSDRELEQKIRQIDKARASTYELISGCLWGDKKEYHLCINTTDLELKAVVPHIAAYIRAWFENETNYRK